ncbi:MAG: preprotein translocase subunit SecY [Chloroflexi bacterium]|nr:preprotein translocase subunit SecY [Chloroflexota bacterium]
MKRSPWRFLWTAKDIRRKLLITFLILAIFRLAAHVPVPGANREALLGVLSGGGAGGTLVGLLDMLSGGTVSNFSVLAMGVYPYITAQIILQLLVPIIPALQKRMEEDPREGQKWMEKWTYLLAVPMAALQAVGQINLLSSFTGTPIIENFGFKAATFIPSMTIILSMTAGTMFAIWLGELISEYGIRGQGLSLIIFAGIVAQIPVNIARLMADETIRWFIPVFLVLLMGLIIFAIVIVQQGRRNVPVLYPGRRVGNRMSMPVKGTLPLLVNMAGMIPLIFAQSLLTFPAIVASFFIDSQVSWISGSAVWMQKVFGGDSGIYWVLYFLMVVGFTFFYTDILFAQQNYGENLKKVGAQVPGVARGAPTQKYLTKVLRRITLPGAVFLGIVAILPTLTTLILSGFGAGLGSQSGLLLVSSSGLLIVVGVVRDLFFNIEAELKLHGYDDTLLVR